MLVLILLIYLCISKGGRYSNREIIQDVFFCRNTTMMLKLLSAGCSLVMMMRMWKQVRSYRFCSHSDEVSGFIFLITFTVLNIPSSFFLFYRLETRNYRHVFTKT